MIEALEMLTDTEPPKANIVYGESGRITRILPAASAHYVGVEYDDHRIALKLFDSAHRYIKGYWVRCFSGIWRCDEINRLGELTHLGQDSTHGHKAGLQPLRDTPELMSAFITLMCS